jgi:hypothetical protein
MLVLCFVEGRVGGLTADTQESLSRLLVSVVGVALAAQQSDSMHRIERLSVQQNAMQLGEIALPALVRIDVFLLVVLLSHRCISYMHFAPVSAGTDPKALEARLVAALRLGLDCPAAE